MVPESKKVKKKKKRKTKENPNVWKRKWGVDDIKDAKGADELSMEFMKHLGICKTERETVSYWKEEFERSKMVDLSDGTRKKVRPGRGFYMLNRGKQLIAGIAGRRSPTEGVNIIVTHLDSPRIDLKPLPLHRDDDTGLGLLRTHYYGGIKKYQWTNIPLALHGRVVREDGSSVDIRLGEDEDEPVFVIPDLLPHLSGKTQNLRKLRDGIRGEEMTALMGSGPLPEENEGSESTNDTEPERENSAVDAEMERNVVGSVLDALYERYKIAEEDLISSELCLVPAWSARRIGLGGGMIGAYGQDNRISSFTSMKAILDMLKETVIPERWCIIVGFDKEEIGSEGNTGARSQFLELGTYRILEWSGGKGNGRELRKTLSSSFALSADVKSAVNPIFRGVQDPQNAARLGAGITITKYTGRGGKSGANDASAEMVSSIRRLLNSQGITWQMQETGKVDQGGGGTVAKFLGARNMDVLDVGIPLLSMHSTFEISSKMDLMTSYLAFRSFLQKHPIKT